MSLAGLVLALSMAGSHFATKCIGFTAGFCNESYPDSPAEYWHAVQSCPELCVVFQSPSMYMVWISPLLHPPFTIRVRRD